MTARARATPAPGTLLLLLGAFLGAALVVYRPAFDGPFLSDDLHYVSENPYVHELSLENTWAVLSPTGPATRAVVNWSPVQLLLHGAAWQVFGSDVRGHHVLNVALHAAASVLLVALLARAGVPLAGAAPGGAWFLLHPANVEAVAWISQLKSSSALLLSLAALLAWPRRPAASTALFALALLAKPTAAFAWPVALVLSLTGGGRVPWRWLGVGALVLAGFAVAELAVHQRSGAAPALLHETPVALLRTVLALAARYAWMAATARGVSAFHEPEPAHSWLDPWWLASLPLLALLAWRVSLLLRRRSPELAWWIWALVSFAPVSQLLPFLYPLADRYLYFIAPGLLGGCLLAGGEALARLPAHRRPWVVRAAAVAAVALLALFAVRSFERAALWRSAATLLADAAAHYPEGVSAHLLRAKRAAQYGDGAAAAAEIRGAAARGYNRFGQLLADPALGPVRSHPEFRAAVREMAGERVETLRAKPDPTQLELRALAGAHAARGEIAAARAALQRALALGGPHDRQIRGELESLGR